MGSMTGGCHLSQPGLLSLVETCTTGLSAHLARRTLCTLVMLAHFSATPEHVSQGKLCSRAETSFATHPGFTQAGAKAPHAHPSPIASTALCLIAPRAPQGPASLPKATSPPPPTAGSAHQGPCPPQQPSWQEGCWLCGKWMGV